MLTIQQINTNSPDQVNRFVDIPYRLYADDPNWLPPPRNHEASYLNRQEHPFYQHSEADFFIAVRGGRDVGRIAVLTHTPGHELYDISEPHFYLFECEDDQEAADALFAQAFAWSKSRGFSSLVGPHGFSMLDGLCLLVDGFDYPQVTTMNPYNYAYYATLLEVAGFVPYGDDFASYHLDIANISLPAWVQEMADTLRAKQELHVQSLDSMDELMMLAPMALEAMMGLSNHESNYLLQHLQSMIDPRLIQTVLHESDGLVALVLGFPNLSSTLRREPGHPTPDALQAEMARTKGIIFNGIFIDPNYQIMGLSALLIREMAKLARGAGVQHAYMVHVQGPGNRQANDISLIGARPVHWHRMYARELS